MECYQRHLSLFLFFQVLAEACGSEITERLMLPTVLTMANDSVANVRFNVAKTLAIVGPKLNSATMASQVKPTLSKLNEDGDFDVRFYASEAASGEEESRGQVQGGSTYVVRVS